jgi:hypothetical protein
MTISFAPIHLEAPDDATRETWLENLADLRSDAEDIVHYVNELNGTLTHGGIPALGLAPVDCAVGTFAAMARAKPALAGLDLIELVGHLNATIEVLHERIATAQAHIAGSRHLEAFAAWVAAYRPKKATDRPDAPFGGLLFDTSNKATARVSCKPETRVWTLICEDDVLAIVPGFRRCDRLGHFICAVERTADAPTEVVIG